MTKRGKLEASLIAQGYTRIVGVDEVGRGCLAGPVYAGSVILNYDALARLDQKTQDYLRDSKKLTPKRRKEMVEIIGEISLAQATASATVEEIESLGIVGATFQAMRRAVASLHQEFDYLLVDGNKPLPDHKAPQASIIDGDNLCYCIAASSILAKEKRDQFMRDKAVEFPDYGFERHVGYGTKQHLDAIAELG